MKKNPKKPKSDYCSYSPDNWFGKDVSEICKVHDEAYAKGGTKQDRQDADVEFGKELMKINWFMGWIYYVAVRLFGGFSWNYRV